MVSVLHFKYKLYDSKKVNGLSPFGVTWCNTEEGAVKEEARDQNRVKVGREEKTQLEISKSGGREGIQRKG